MLDWEEGVFTGGRALLNFLWTNRKNKPYQLASVKLDSIRMELFYFAHLISGQKISLFETDEPILRIGRRLCLPKLCSIHTEIKLNRNFYLLKTAMGALSLNHSDVISEMKIHYPGLLELWEEQMRILPKDFPAQLVFEKIGVESSSSKNEINLLDRSDEENKNLKNGTIDKNATEIEGKGRTEVEVLAEKDLQSPDVPQHTFEKVETLEEFEGLDRPLDGSDEIQDHAEALDELELKHVIRSKDRTASIYRADIVMSPLELNLNQNSPLQGIPYPEWDYQKKSYKPNWWWIQVTELEKKENQWLQAARIKHKAQIHNLKRKLEQFSTDFLRARAQPQGNEFDIEAVVESYIRMQSGGAPSENIYVARNRDLSDVATLILIDQSDSTDAWVKDEHVLEILRGALYCLGEVLEAFTHQFAIAGFASDTRKACKYFPIKNFEETWNKALPRLGGLNPQGYTRIGPAMRHGIKQLEKISARKKAILLISDGRPCDYDTYEGNYGIQDVKKAFWEAREKGILTHAFAVDHKAREYFPAMFAPKNYSVIAEPKDLTDAIFRFFMNLKTHE